MNSELPIKYEFDAQKSIFHLTADAEIHITTEEELDQLCDQVCGTLEVLTSSGDRCYMVVDLTKFIIEPELFDSYGKKIQYMQDRFLYKDSLIRYGYRITRLTIKMSQQRTMNDDPHLFDTKEDAFKYIDSLIEKRQQELSR